MKGNMTFISIMLLIFLGIDLYVFQGVKALLHGYSPGVRKFFYVCYWSLTALTILVFLMFHFGSPEKWSRLFRTIVFGGILVNYFTKIFFLVFLLIDDLQRLFRWIIQKISLMVKSEPLSSGPAISRSDFLMKAGLVFSAIPFLGMSYGILTGAHDYRVRKIKLKIPGLPQAFKGLRIAQISDIHCGSFYNKSAVSRGIDMLMDQKPDMIFFTGDLVNNEASELESYLDIFSRVQAPMGVFSILGNHDYGDYIPWPSEEAKQENLDNLIKIQKYMGWDILLNEHRVIEKEGSKIAILGVENWSAKGRFQKYGNLDKAYKGTEGIPVKLLLTHDPSHWEGEVRKKFKNINVTFAGHTHGFQFGVEKGNIKWSPVQYVYDQWAGLYKKGGQYLYVNRGFGFIGFPGRIGIPPEITVFELSV